MIFRGIIINFSVKSIKKNEKTTWLLIIPILIVSPKRLKKSLGGGGGDSEKYTPLFQAIIE